MFIQSKPRLASQVEMYSTSGTEPSLENLASQAANGNATVQDASVVVMAGGYVQLVCVLVCWFEHYQKCPHDLALQNHLLDRMHCLSLLIDYILSLLICI